MATGRCPLDTKFEHIASDLIGGIKSGKYREKLPSERELARIYDTTPVTAAKALNYLQEKNIVFRKRGNGTFVNTSSETRTAIRIMLQNRFLSNDIERLLTERFPEYSFIFSERSCRDLCEEFKENDIIWHCSSVMPAGYDSLCRPLPFSFVSEKLKGPAYNTDVFNVHKCHLHYYGLPLLYSPILLTYNKTLFRKLNIPLPEAPYTIRQIYELKKLLNKNKGIYLFDAYKPHFSPAMNCILVNLPFGASLSEMKWENLKKGLETMRDLYSDSISEKAYFSSGNVLFSYNCRQTLEQHVIGKFNFEWDILPVFQVNTSFCTIGTECCFISASSPLSDDALLPVLDFLIEKDVQDLLAEKHFGLPVLKSSALDSMKNSSYRDDYFFREIRNVIYENNLFEKDILWLFGSFVNEYFEGERSFKELMTDTEALFRSDRLKKSAGKNVTFKNGAPEDGY